MHTDVTYHCDGFLLGDCDGGLATATLAASVTASASSGSGGTRASSRRSSKDSDGRGGGGGADDGSCRLATDLFVATRGLYPLVLSNSNH
jgi:hypothetical protein